MSKIIIYSTFSKLMFFQFATLIGIAVKLGLMQLNGLNKLNRLNFVIAKIDRITTLTNYAINN